MHFATFDWFWLTVTLVLIAGVMGAVQGTCAYLILAERKISAWAQDRVGPNRVGRDFYLPFGLLQPIADGIKFLLKEQVIPNHVDKLFYLLAPMIAVGTATLAIGVVPVGRTTAVPALLDRRPDRLLTDPEFRAFTPELEQAALLKYPPVDRPQGTVWPASESEKKWALAYDRAWAKSNEKPTFEEQLKEYNDTVQFVIIPRTDIGIVFVLAVGSLAAYAIVLGGWSSNNKYSFLGSLRSSAQLISYEIPMGMSILGVFLVSGSLNVENIIQYQIDHGWNFLFQPVALLLFTTAIFAECNRVPFDLPECEQELVGGYHTEYSGMKFALFFLGEYTHMITTSFLVIHLFFGGWHLPFVTSPEPTGLVDMILKLLILAVKMIVFVIFYMYIRWTIPRFRFDQLMALAWKVMMPLALISFLVVLFVKHFELSVWLMPVLSLAFLVIVTLLSLRMPRPPLKANLVVRGHPVSGERALLN